MVPTLSNALAQVKADLPALIARHVAKYLQQHPRPVRRQRLLDPLTTLLLFIQQVLAGNTAINHLRHFSVKDFTATAYCQARKRLPLELLEQLCRQVTGDLRAESDPAGRWRGHRLWRADATGFSMPDTPQLQKHFGQPGGQAPGCGFPVAMLLTLCNSAGMIIKTIALPLRTHEASQIAKLHGELEAGDVLVYDRAGCSYAHLALLSLRNLQIIARMHQKRIVSFRPGRKHASKARRRGKPTSQWLKRLGFQDQLVRWFKPKSRPKWMDRQAYDALPDALVLRELRYSVRRRGFRSRSITLVSTLTDPRKYPARELAQQYLGRWEIELNFRHLKTTMRMDVLKCKTLEGVLKELAVFTLVYNLVRLVMLRAARRQEVPLDRISFIDALRWLAQAGSARESRDLIVQPQRRGRVEPRVLKRRPKEYPLMKRPRSELRQALLDQGVAA